jgi:hypothetical protein
MVKSQTLDPSWAELSIFDIPLVCKSKDRINPTLGTSTIDSLTLYSKMVAQF